MRTRQRDEWKGGNDTRVICGLVAAGSFVLLTGNTEVTTFIRTYHRCVESLLHITMSKRLKRVILVLRTVVVCVWPHVTEYMAPLFGGAGCSHLQGKYGVPHKVWQTLALYVPALVTEWSNNVCPIISRNVIATTLMMQGTLRHGTYELLWTTVTLTPTSGKQHSFFILFSGAQNCAWGKVNDRLKSNMCNITENLFSWHLMKTDFLLRCCNVTI
jgi:hypothetical protein